MATRDDLASLYDSVASEPEAAPVRQDLSSLYDEVVGPPEKPGILRSFATGVTKFPYSEYLATVASSRRMGGMNAPDAKTPGNSDAQGQRALLHDQWGKARDAHPDAFNSGSGVSTALFSLPAASLAAPEASAAPFTSRVADAAGRSALLSALVGNGLSERPDFWGKVADTAGSGIMGGLFGGLTPAPLRGSEVISQAAPLSGLKERAGIQAVKAHGAREQEIATLQNKWGGKGSVGDEAHAGLRSLEMKTPEGKPVVPFFGGHKRIAKNYEQVIDSTGRELGGIKRAVDEKNPAAVDMAHALDEATQRLMPRFDNRAMRGAHGKNVAGELKQRLSDIADDFTAEQEVARNIDYPTPEQAQTDMFSRPGRLVAGPDATMVEPPPQQVGSEIYWQQRIPGSGRAQTTQAAPSGEAEFQWTPNRQDVYFQRDIPGTDRQSTPVQGPLAGPGWTTVNQQDVLPGMPNTRATTMSGPVYHDISGRQTGLAFQDQLPGMPEPMELVPGRPVMRDVSATGNTQSLAHQGELPHTREWRVNDTGPRMGRVGSAPLSETEQLKTNLGNRSRMTKSTKYPDRNPDAIAADPDLAQLDALRDSVRREGEKAVERELGPSVLSEFLRLKGQHGFSKEMEKVAHNSYNGGVSNGASRIPTSRHHLASALLSPTHAPRARLYYGLSQAGETAATTRDNAGASTVAGTIPGWLQEFLDARGQR